MQQVKSTLNISQLFKEENIGTRFLWSKVCVCDSRSYLFRKHGYVFVERVGGADVASRHTGLSGRAGRQLALLKHQSQQRE